MWVWSLARAVLYQLTPALLGTLLSLPDRWRSFLEKREPRHMGLGLARARETQRGRRVQAPDS